MILNDSLGEQGKLVLLFNGIRRTPDQASYIFVIKPQFFVAQVRTGHFKRHRQFGALGGNQMCAICFVVVVHYGAIAAPTNRYTYTDRAELPAVFSICVEGPQMAADGKLVVCRPTTVPLMKKVTSVRALLMVTKSSYSVSTAKVIPLSVSVEVPPESVVRRYHFPELSDYR